MSILDSSLAPGIFLLAGFAVLAGFFRKTLLRTAIILLIEIIFFALFPVALVSFVHLIVTIRQSLG